MTAIAIVSGCLLAVLIASDVWRARREARGRAKGTDDE